MAKKNNNDVRRAVYAGTFDPITKGHESIITRGTELFDEVICAIGLNPKKQTLFTLEERLDMIMHVTKGMNVEVDAFSGLLVDYLKENNVKNILRGLRIVTDFEYEFQIGLVNKILKPDVETVFLIADQKHIHLSSSIVKEIASHNGDVDLFVSDYVTKQLRAKYEK